jgi:flagellar biosynthesis chaperone FliJ
MISLGGLVNQKAFGKFEMGKVISNPFANAFVNEAEGSEDHEVSMANNSLDTIIKMATELKAKMGENEKDIPAWIQDHITNAENFISQASSNYHEYGNGGMEEATQVPTGEKIQNLNNRIKVLRAKIGAQKDAVKKSELQKTLKNALQSLSNIKSDFGIKKENSIKEDSPCWKGYKQVGMKDKGGRQVPNCVPNESVVKEISSRTPKIFVKTAAVEKKIKELMADRKKAVVPYNSETDPAKKEKLKQILIKLTNQIKGYENNLVKLRDMEEDYLQQMHADAELDTTGL